jgi:Leucine-rich repeat (LRR) protein|tara:strand:+ start:368 stop:1108 length:741 start_codon:yes stop_codon:yes gene_type:complete
MEHRLDYVCNFLGVKKEAAKELTTLDFCLDDICRMDFISHFGNLKELILINQGISVMEGLDRLKNLEKCWLTHNFFDQIKGLDKLRNIKELYLGWNRLTRTTGLEKCVMLEKLWMDCNQIDLVSGLGSLERLEHLNLAGNNIEQIGIGFDGMVSLSNLNLSANKIGNFKEVLNLNRLPCLSICTFNDPHYGDNPICNLCNYSTYVLYHLPRLYRLDTEMISDDSKNFAEGTFMKKRMYYNMRIKTI